MGMLVHTPQQMQHVEQLLTKIEAARMQLRSRYLQQQRSYHAAVLQGTAAFQHERTIDDAARFLSFLTALSKCVDKAVLVGNSVLQDEYLRRRCEQGPLRHQLQLWRGTSK